MGREIEVRRHTDADGDVLTAEGVRAALTIGAGLRGEYDLAVSTARLNSHFPRDEKSVLFSKL